MILEYKNLYAQLNYSASTKTYHGAIEGDDFLIAFQAQLKQDLQSAMQQAIDQLGATKFD